MTLTSGTRLGPYEIQAPLGAGGMGDVYKAKDTRLDRTVAVSIGGGQTPVWNRDASELFCASREQTLMSVSIRSAGAGSTLAGRSRSSP